MKFKASLAILFFIVCSAMHARQYTSDDYRELDSMKNIWANLEGFEKAETLSKIVGREEDPDSILRYTDILLSVAELDSLHTFMYDAYLQKGNAYGYLGSYSVALEMYLLSIESAKKINAEMLVGSSYIAIAGNFVDSKNEESAVSYYRKGIETLRDGMNTRDDSISYAVGLFNFGDLYLKLGKIDSAEVLIKDAKEIFEEADLMGYEPYWLGSFGIIAASHGNDESAEEYLNRSILMMEDYYDYSNISIYLRSMAGVYLEQEQFGKALEYGNQSLSLAKEYDLRLQISEVNLLLSKIYEQLGDKENAFDYYKTHISYRDSINNLATIRNIADQRTEFEVSQKQAELTIVSLQAKRQSLLLYGAVAMLILAGLLMWLIFKRFKFEKETKEIIQTEKKRSDDLLLNILPVEIADELMAEGKVKAQRFDSVTVLFSDFKSFTSVAESIEPEQLVESIDFYFKEFDRISERHGLEKIKTIGDSYMTAGGIPEENKENVLNVARAAKAMMEFTLKPKPKNIVPFEMRIGIHTGPVVAGIVGLKKWQYDIWGDTVNVASRMESNSEPGKINISESSHQILKEHYTCEFRGSVEVKNRGIWKMYFLGDPINNEASTG